MPSRVCHGNWAPIVSAARPLPAPGPSTGAPGPACRGCLPDTCRQGTRYFNVGHSNLDTTVLESVADLDRSRTIIMIHDTIPLDHPDHQREGTVSVFQRKLDAVRRFADLVVTPSEASRADVLRHLGVAAAPVRAAHLGITPSRPDPAALPAWIDLGRPYFVSLGTIEPRKNHALLLDVWEEMTGQGPGLFICGSRGWRNEAVFARLDAGIAGVTEIPGLSDGAISALLARSAALLFPSFAEGYGLPAMEAAALGTRVICSELPVFRETLGAYGVYLPPTDRYQWEKTIEAIAGNANETPGPVQDFKAPTWSEHFKLVLNEA